MRLLLISSILAACLQLTSATLEVQPEGNKASTFEIVQDFRTPKNIMFSCMYGGSSHMSWVLSILDELSNRGHSPHFLTRDDYLRLSENYPHIKSKSIGPVHKKKEEREFLKTIRDLSLTDAIKGLLSNMAGAFEPEYVYNVDYIQSHKIDLAICDHFCSPCVEAALLHKIPFIITGTFPYSPDTLAPYVNSDFLNMKNPTTEFMSLKDRMYDMFVSPVRLIFAIRKSISDERKTYKSLGLSPAMTPQDKWKDSIKLFNTAFGFTPGRPIGPLAELVGPIMPKKYPTLNHPLESFLHLHKKVAYVAFGQHITPTAADTVLLFTALLESMELGHIDGIIWAAKTCPGSFSRTITTSSNTTYDLSKFGDLEAYSNIMLVKWAPQMALLQHPSTLFYITHGGAGSIYESLYSGVRFVTYPIFGDQLLAAGLAEKNGYGLTLSFKSTQENANQIVQSMAIDKDGIIQGNTDKFKALVQIRSSSGVTRSADVIEEVLFTHKENGDIPHRWDAKRDMSFIKANNYDIYLIVFTSLGCIGYIALSVCRSFVTFNRKVKTL